MVVEPLQTQGDCTNEQQEKSSYCVRCSDASRRLSCQSGLRFPVHRRRRSGCHDRGEIVSKNLFYSINPLYRVCEEGIFIGFPIKLCYIKINNINYKLMPIKYPPPEEKKKDKEIRIRAIRVPTMMAVGATILIAILVGAWWLFFRGEDANQNTNQAVTNTKTKVSEVLTSEVIDKYSEAKYGYKFDKHSDVEGLENQIGTKGTDFVQIFSSDGIVAQVSYSFKIENEQISSTQIEQAKEFAGFMTGDDFANWAEEKFLNGAPSNNVREFASQAPFYNGSLYSRIRYDDQGNGYWGSITLAYNRRITDSSVFNFDYIGEEKDELESFLPENSLF